MPDQSRAADEHAILQDITAPLASLGDPLPTPEETDFPRELAEQALAHTLQNKTEAAYRRGDAIEKRRAMMEAWADFCEPGGVAPAFSREI